MEEILSQHFNIKNAKVHRLTGMDNANYLVETNDDRYIFKTYPYDDDLLDQIEAEIDVLLFLEGRGTVIPKPIATKSGNYIEVVEIDGIKHICRLLTFLDGSFMGEVESTPELVHSLGLELAKLDRSLLAAKNNTIRARRYKWDLQYLSLNQPDLEYIADAHNRSLVHYFMQQFELKVQPHISELRHSILHNDANEWNILVKGNKVTGFIDFGDACYSPLINELAIALTYVCYNKSDPMHWASLLIKAYHSILPLKELEIQLLYYLIASRLCISVCNAAQARRSQPENEYALISEDNAWNTLHRWISFNPRYVENLFRKAAGFQELPVKSMNEKIDQRKAYFGSNLSLSYDRPIYMEKAAFQYMYDYHGNTFLDAYNNIPLVGHCHPRVVEAGYRAMTNLNTNTRYVYDELYEYAEALLDQFPSKLNKVFFVNSGSAATDLALRMAQAHTKNNRILVMEHGYHGNTKSGIEASHYKFNNKKGQGLAAHVEVAPIPDTFRGQYREDDKEAGTKYAQDIVEKLKTKEQVGTYITESILGCGGQVPLANQYLETLFPYIRAQGGVCIIDEVQTGFGRVGHSFWAYEAYDVIPDMVILGKPMGNGHPMGAVVCTDEVAASFEQGVEFFSSFGGNPVSCAIGTAVLNTIQDEQLQENALDVGNYFMQLLKQQQPDYPEIGDVRGSGLFIGIDLVHPGSRNPNTALAHFVKNELRNRHVLVSTDGPADNVIKSKPPLCFSRDNALHVVEELVEALKRGREEEFNNQ